MSNTATKQVPYSYKIAFGFGMLANQMFPAVLSIFMVVLVQDLGFPGWMWGVLFFLPRIFDSFTDPIMGFISDNTRSKWGRRRQYVLFGAIFMSVSFMIMWQLYADNGVTYNFTYFLAWSIAFFLGLTIFSVPYVAMGYEMSDDFHERTQIMAIAQWIGQWAWVIAPWFWVIMYDPAWFESAEVATRTLAIWVGAIFMVCAMIPALVIKSESTVDKEEYSPLTFSTIGNSFKEILISFKEAFESVPFRRLCVATFFIFNAFNTVAAFTFFVIVYHLFAGDSAAAGVWPTLFGSLGAGNHLYCDSHCYKNVEGNGQKESIHVVSRYFHHRLYPILVLANPWQALHVHFRIAILLFRNRKPLHLNDVDDGRRNRLG